MNLRYKCFDVEIYEELEQKKLKGNVCFEIDIKDKILDDFEDLDLVIKSIKNNDFDKFGILNILKVHKKNKLRTFGKWEK